MTLTRYKIVDGVVCIELSLKIVQQLFDMRDPSPFRERDLDDKAVVYILAAAREFPLSTPLKLRISFSEESIRDLEVELIRDAIHNHFAYEADLTGRRLKETLKEGQISFVIGLFFLMVCESLAYLFFSDSEAFLSRMVGGGLGIIGYVAMWKPVDVFLYAWWPIAKARKYFSKLAGIPVEIASEDARRPDASDSIQNERMGVKRTGQRA